MITYKAHILDDDPIYCQILHYQLEKIDWLEVTSFNYAVDFLEHTRSNGDPDFMIIDHNLNDFANNVNGNKLAEYLRSSGNSYPIFIISNNYNEEDNLNFLKQNSIVFIEKNDNTIQKLTTEMLSTINDLESDEAFEHEKENYSKIGFIATSVSIGLLVLVSLATTHL